MIITKNNNNDNRNDNDNNNNNKNSNNNNNNNNSNSYNNNNNSNNKYYNDNSNNSNDNNNNSNNTYNNNNNNNNNTYLQCFGVLFISPYTSPDVERLVRFTSQGHEGIDGVQLVFQLLVHPTGKGLKGRCFTHETWRFYHEHMVIM